jgi:hypothetical protein
MKHLKDRGLLDGTKWKRLNVVMDNCSGQNKNSIVLRLSPCLQEKGFFLQTNFIFLVVRHAKNIADRIFNTLKKLCRSKNLFSMGMLVECMKHELVIPCQVDWRFFMDRDKYLTRFYKKMSSVLKWQMLQSSTELWRWQNLFQEQQRRECRHLGGKSTETKRRGRSMKWHPHGRTNAATSTETRAEGDQASRNVQKIPRPCCQ